MKARNILLSLAVIGSLTLGMADETATTNTSSQTTTSSSVTTTNSSGSVDTQIAKIQSAKGAERVELMNAFKQRVAGMNQEDRMAAINEMRTQMQANAQAHMQSGMQMGEETRQRAHEMQQNNMPDMHQMQNMNQMQAGNQFMHEQNMGAGMGHAGAGAGMNAGNAGAGAGMNAGNAGATAGTHAGSENFSHAIMGR